MAAAENQPQAAVRLFAAANRMRETLGTPTPPVERAEHDRSVVALRDILGAVAFAAAWAEGQEMTLDQAIAHALDEPE